MSELIAVQHTFSRQELYDLVWSEPMRLLAKRYDVSGRGLAKACVAANIPVPERGYWNKVQAGKKVSKRNLPTRGLGQSDRITIGGNAWQYHRESDEEILQQTIPPEPTFESEIESLRLQVVAMVNKAKLPKNLTKPHRLISRLLDQDEVRLKKKLSDPFPFPWDGPIFRTAFEERRLKIMNGLFVCLEFCGMKPFVSGREARELSVIVGSQHIMFTLDSVEADKQMERERSGYCFQARGDKDRMRLVLNSSYSPYKDCRFWEDKGEDRVENHIQEIAAEMIVLGEERYRSNCFYQREWLIKKKEEIIEERQKQKIEAERMRQAHLAELEKQRIDHLLAQASDLHKAELIRTYVASVRRSGVASLHEEGLAQWEEWALAQADRIDPITSGKYKLRPAEPKDDI